MANPNPTPQKKEEEIKISRDGVEASGSSSKILAIAAAANLTIVVGTASFACIYCLLKSENPEEFVTNLVEKVVGSAEATLTQGGIGSLKFNIVAKTKQASDQILSSYSSGEMLKKLNELLLGYTKKLGLAEAEFDSVDLVKFEKTSISDEEFEKLKKNSSEVIKSFTKELLDQGSGKKIKLEVSSATTSADVLKPELSECIRANDSYLQTQSKESVKTIYKYGSQIVFLPVLFATFMQSIVESKFGFSQKIIQEMSFIVQNFTSSLSADVIKIANFNVEELKNPSGGFLFYSVSAKILENEVSLSVTQKMKRLSQIVDGLKDSIHMLVDLDWNLKYAINVVMPLMNKLQQQITNIPVNHFDSETLTEKRIAEVVTLDGIANSYRNLGDNFSRKKVANKGIMILQQDLEQKQVFISQEFETVYVMLLNNYADACDNPNEQDERKLYYQKAIDFANQILQKRPDNVDMIILLNEIKNNLKTATI